MLHVSTFFASAKGGHALGTLRMQAPVEQEDVAGAVQAPGEALLKALLYVLLP